MGFFDKLAMIKSPWVFQAKELAEYTGQLKNPQRGWYQIHTFLIEDEPDLDELEWCIDKNDTLAVLVIDIGSAAKRDLGNGELERIRKILAFFRENNYNVILRIAYDHEGMAIEREPDFLSQIQAHIEQLWKVLGDYDDTVFIFQGMLIGNWGEMHTSKFLAQEKLEGIAQTLRNNKSYKTFLAVRRPVFWRKLHEPDIGLNSRPSDMMGLFDDAIFASATDLGTYGDQDAVSAGWVNAWKREDELDFEDRLCQNVPNGGEVVFGENYSENLGAEEMIRILQKKHITYLNRLHDARLLELWKGMKPIQTGCWKDKTFYEYIGAHLGYRFFIRKVIVKPDRNNSRDFAVVEIWVENQGFASLYEEAELFLICEGEDGQTQNYGLPVDMRKWQAAGQYTVLCHIRVVAGRMYLSARRKENGAAIRFANVSDSPDKLFLGTFAGKEK